jgi:1,4-dihydroxy-2-naphthoate octaprenyltransferase
MAGRGGADPALSWPRLALTLSGVALVHLGVNLANDYFDHLQGSDWVNARRTKYNGGAGVIQAGLVRPRQVALVAAGMLAVAAAIGTWLAFAAGPMVWWLMAAGFVLGVGYSAPPLALMGSGWGELVAGLCCGPLVALGAHYVAGGQGHWTVLAASIPVGLLVSAILVINEVPDFAADGAVGKRNLVVRMGPGAGLRLHRWLVLASYAWIAGLVLGGQLPAGGLAVAATAPLAWWLLRNAGRGVADAAALTAASAGTAGLQALVGVVLTASFLVR